jgi:hypothetical protein
MKNLNFVFKLAACVILLASTSCGKGKIKIDDLKVFPKATEGMKYPEFTTRVQTESNLTGLDVKERIGKYEQRIFGLIETTKLSEVAQFYDTELKSKGFEKENAEPVKSVDTRILYYKKTGFGSSAKVAIAFIEIEDYDTKKIYPFLTVYVSR